MVGYIVYTNTRSRDIYMYIMYVICIITGLALGLGQVRQTKSKKENRYVIKVIRFKQGRGYGS
jgi:hypothetical protein